MIRLKSIRILALSFAYCLVGLPSRAQLIQASAGVRDLGSAVGGTAADQVVTGGTTRGNNLFHSFSRFGIATGGSATFDGAGTLGIDNIFGRIEAGPSQMDGSLRLQNWGGNPSLILLNPFGFTIGSNFSSTGLTDLTLMAVDALLMEDPAGNIFAFDLDLTAAGLGVANPDWAAASFRGGVAEVGFGASGYGQGGSTITVNGDISVQALKMAGSVVDVNSMLTADDIGLYAQGFQGSFLASDPFVDTFEAGDFDPANSTFTPFNNAAQVGGVAPTSGFVSSLSQLKNPSGLGSCAGPCPAGTIRFQAASGVDGLNTSSPTLTLWGRQTVLDSDVLSNASSVTRTAFLGNGLYSSEISFASSSDASSTTDEVTAEFKNPSNWLVDLEDIPALTSPPLTFAFSDFGLSVDANNADSKQESLNLSASTSSFYSGDGLPGVPASETNLRLSPSTGDSVVKTLSVSELQTSFLDAESLISSQVAMALGLDSTADSSTPLAIADVQLILRQAIESVRSKGFSTSTLNFGLRDFQQIAFAKTSTPLPLFTTSALPAVSPERYQPAVVHLRFLEALDAFRSGPELEIILITADGAPHGFRVTVNREQFASVLRDFYRSLARHENLDVANSDSPSRALYDLIFRELDSLLQQQQVTTLLLSADRGLQAVPYAALHDGQNFLGERYALSLTPSLSLTPLAGQSRNDRSILALGASKFEGLAPLPLVPAEVLGVTEGRNSSILLDQEFTPDSLLITASDPQFGLLHVATHAEFLPGGPDQSVLYTGTRPLSLVQLRRLRERGVAASLDLFSLSACRTAVGDPDSELGFAGLALQAGARSAIGSLWYVDDVATSAFFIQVYSYIKNGIPKAEALQLTRRAFAAGLIQLSGDKIVGPDGNILLEELDSSQQYLAQSGFNHPYFWAGIQLLGSPW